MQSDTGNQSYSIYSAIRQGFPLSRMTPNKAVIWNFAMIRILPFLNNPKDLDPSYMLDLDFLALFWKEKSLSHNRRNTVAICFACPITAL